jgi:hypothetical protein
VQTKQPSSSRNHGFILESRFHTLFSTETQNFPFFVFPSGKKFYVYQKPLPQESDRRPSGS